MHHFVYLVVDAFPTSCIWFFCSSAAGRCIQGSEEYNQGSEDGKKIMARSIGVFFLLSLPLSLCLRITSPMAPACRILTSPMSAAEPYEGAGFNRKIRRRPLRRAAETPYDRPAAAIQGLRIQSAAAVAERNGWISKIFQPAMRIIARSASHIFPSMFQTPLPPPSEAAAGMTDPCTDENHHSCKGFSEVACTNPSPKVWEPCSSDAVNLVNNSSPDGAQRILNSDGNGISELEILLKQKTFTRSEFDRLTELLRSRTIEPSSWQPTVIYEKGEANVSGQENENDTRSNGNIPTPALSLRNQLFREDALPSIIPYGRQISQISTASKFVTHFSGISEAHQNGHMLLRPIGRTAMHRMARSPYFKAASATNIKVHDLGSHGPIRRLRQKSNLISLSKDIQWPHGNRLPEDNKVPNGKEKTCQSTITFRDDLPSKLTTSMLQGRALKNMEDIDWPKFLNLKGKDKLDAPNDSHVQKPESSISLKQGKIANTVESCPSISGVKVIETVGAVSGSVAVSSGKRAPFRMSPPEDDFDLGDDDSSQTKLNTEAVMKASATKGGVEFSFPVAPACSSFSLPPPAPTMPSPLLERSSLQEEQISAPSQTKSNTEAVMKASDKSATKGDFEFSFPVAPACSSFSLAPTMPFGFKFNASNSTTTALPGSSYPVNDRKSLEAGDLFETSVIATSSCLPTSGPAVIGTLSPSSDSFSTSAPSVAPSTSMSNAQIVTSAAPWFELGSLLSTAIKRSSSMEFKVMPEEASSVSTSSAISSLTSTAMCSNSNPVLVTSTMFSSTTSALSTTSSLSASPFGFTSPAQPSTTTLPIADGSSKTSLGIFGTTPGSIFGSQATVVGVGSSPFSLTAESQFGSSTSVTGSLFEASDSQMSSNDFGAKPFGSTVLSFTSSYFSSPTAAASLSTFNSQKSAPSIFSFSTSSPFIASSSASTGFTSSFLGFGSSFFAAAGSQTLTHSIFDHMDVDEGSMADDSIPAAASTIPEARFSIGSSSQPSASAEQMEIDSCTIQSEPKYDPRLFEDLRRLPQYLCDPTIDGSIQAAPSTIPPARFSLGSTSQPSTSADEMEIDGPTMEEMMALALTRLGEDPRQKRFNDFVKLYPFYFADEIGATPSVLSRMRELSDARSSRFTGPSLTASCSP